MLAVSLTTASSSAETLVPGSGVEEADIGASTTTKYLLRWETPYPEMETRSSEVGRRQGRPQQPRNGLNFIETVGKKPRVTDGSSTHGSQ